MEELDQDHLVMLRLMVSILRERQSLFCLNDVQRHKCREGIKALDRAVEALELQVYA